MSVDVDALVHVEPAIRPPLERVQDVMRILRSESGEDDVALVGLAGTLGVFEVEQLGRLPDEAAVALWQAGLGGQRGGRDAGGEQQSLGEDRALRRLAGVIGIIDDDDLVGLFAAGSDLWVKRAAGHPQAALRIPIHLGRLEEQGILRPELDLEAFIEREFRLGQRRDGLGVFGRGKWVRPARAGRWPGPGRLLSSSDRSRRRPLR